MKTTLFIFVWILQIVLSALGNIYHNQFAVHIPGGSADPDQVAKVARRHEFINLGQIGSLKDHFLFEHSRIHKRSTEHSLEHHKKLKDDPEVFWFEQQKEIRRVKRDRISDGFEDATVFPDPLFEKQWFINHGAADGSDMNVQPAWKHGFTGKNVVVTILDDGIQHDHPDLRKNYDPKASYDINGQDPDPMPQDNNDNKHGTRCAGEVAAEAYNNVCGVGIAFNASIGGVRMLDGVVNDAVEAQALSLNPEHIDIYSASWGPEDDGKTVDGPGSLAKKAFIDGVKKGRKGKGSIFVWASGNGGRKIDNCNCDGYTNSIFTLSISSATQGGRKPWYLEECSSTLASTYSSGTPNHDASITTVDQDARLRPNKICTSSHTGTSASAPIAAGICALALEANSNLTWRDMQHIVVMTSNPNPLLMESGWQINGVNRKFSHKFGYGLMDAWEMVQVASKWRGVGPQVICQTDKMTHNIPIPSDFRTSAKVQTDSNACAGTKKEVKFLEHVQCQISLHFNPRGALHITLISPSGTRSSLLLPRPKDLGSSSFDKWPFLSVHFWGEPANGTWTLEISRSSDVKVGANPRGILKDWKLFFYGTQTAPPELRMNNGEYPSSPSQPASENTIEQHEFGPKMLNDTIKSLISLNAHKIGPDGCNIECRNGCNGPGPHQCKECEHFMIDTVCVEECPLGTFSTLEKTCHICHSSCKACFGPSFNQCLSCMPSKPFLITEKGECNKSCSSLGSRFLESPSQGQLCIKCPANCKTCESAAATNDKESADVICTSCLDDLVLFSEANMCLNSCPGGYYEHDNGQSKSCKPCHHSCLTCIGYLDTQCSRCQPGLFFFEHKCIPECPRTTYHNPETQECMSCPTGCAECSSSICDECVEHWSFNQVLGICEPIENEQCPPKTFFDMANGNCKSCYSICTACGGRKPDNCLACNAEHMMHISTCVDSCPISTFRAGRDCIHCPHACKECSDLHNCYKCEYGYVLSLDGSRCVANCNPAEYIKNGQCRPCHKKCETCFGPTSTSCLSCPASKFLFHGECRSVCPTGYFADLSSATCLPCSPSCLDCFGPSTNECKSCKSGMNLQLGVCLPCSNGRYFSKVRKACTSCHSTCKTCSGHSSNNCTSCHEDGHETAFDPERNQCVSCCDHATADDSQCCECDHNDKTVVCKQPVREHAGARKRSFREDFSKRSQSTLIFMIVLTSVALSTCLVLKMLRKRRLRRWMHPKKIRQSNGRRGYTKIPLGELGDLEEDDPDSDVEIDLDEKPLVERAKTKQINGQL